MPRQSLFTFRFVSVLLCFLLAYSSVLIKTSLSIVDDGPHHLLNLHSSLSIPPPVVKRERKLVKKNRVVKTNKNPQKKENPPPVWDEAINVTEEKARCRRYNYEYDGRTSRRRIFMGSLIADDSWHVIQVVATEAYGIYHSVAFVESNATMAYFDRKLRFTPNSADLKRLQGGIYGPTTKVTVDYYYDGEVKPDDPIDREDLQRELILRRWKANGMQPDGIGLLTDTDETFTRDFLRAAQICDVPSFRPGQDCRNPKVAANSMVFESTPECITQLRQWSHPDMVLGECIQGIGDESIHKPAKREFIKVKGVHKPAKRESDGMHGARKPGYGYEDENDYDKMPNITMFPLLNGADFRQYVAYSVGWRRGEVDWESLRKKTGQPTSYTGYHFHNFFERVYELRWKYMTYGHLHYGTLNDRPLRKLSPDVDLAVNCALNRTDTSAYGNKSRFYVMGGLMNLVGPKPIFYDKPGRREQRHQQFIKMVKEDMAFDSNRTR